MSKEYIMIPILVFWLVLPIPLMLMGYNGYDVITLRNLDKVSNPSIFDYGAITLNLFIVYFSVIFLWIKGAGLLINTGLFILKAISGLVFLFALRGV